MIQCKKNWTLFPELQLPIAKNSVLSKYSIPKLAYKVDHDPVLSGSYQTLRLVFISKIFGDIHTKGLLVTNLV